MAITIISPKGGEVWTRGLIYNIKWTSADLNIPGSTVTIELLKGGILSSVLTTNAQNDGVWEWETNEFSLNVGTDFKIRVRNNINGTGNVSAGTFTINPAINNNIITLLFDGSFHLTDTWTGYGKPFGAWSFTTLPSKNTLIVSKSTRKSTDVTGKFTHYTAPTPNETSVDRGLLGSNIVHNLPNGYIMWSGFSIKLDPSWKFPYIVDGASKRGWELFWEVQQMFTMPDGSLHAYSPSLAIEFMNGDNPLKLKYLPILGKPIIPYDIVSMVPGIWYDIMIHTKLTTNNDGYFHVYIRKEGETSYTKVVTKTGVPTLLQQDSSQGPIRANSAVGYYRTHSTVVKSIYFENIKYGTARADVEYNPGPCTPDWKCETPLNGYESDGCGNRRFNPVCNMPKKYKCLGAPFYQCKEDVTGTYDTLEACNSACATQRPTLSSIIVTPSMATISMFDSLVVVGTAIDSQGNTMGGIPIVWTADPAGVVEIDPINTTTFIDGKISTKIKGIAPGMCIIKGSSGSISGQLIADVNVAIPPPPPPPTPPPPPPPPDITEERAKNEKILLAALAALSFLRWK